jgi:hypothetical protein
VTASSALQAATISDQGGVLLALANGAGGTTVTVAGNGKTLLSLGGFGGFAYLPGVDSAVVADSIANSLTLIQSVSTQPVTQVLNIPSGLLVKPFAVQTSADGHWALVANSGENSVVRVDLSGVTPAVKVQCPVPVTQLLPWSGNASFALASPASGPVWMLSGTEATPRVLFVPAPVIAEVGNASATGIAPGRRSR